MHSKLLDRTRRSQDCSDGGWVIPIMVRYDTTASSRGSSLPGSEATVSSEALSVRCRFIGISMKDAVAMLPLHN
jgi:hypothetical protein